MEPDAEAPLAGGRISYVFMLALDHERLHAFYRDLLGMHEVAAEPGHYAFLAPGDDETPLLAIYPGRTQDADAATHWFFVIDVPDIERAVRVLRCRGVEVDTIHDVPAGRAAALRDPEGNVVQLHQRTA